MKFLKRILNRLRLAIEITVLTFMLYSFTRTIFGVKVLTERGSVQAGGGIKKYLFNFVLWFSDYYSFAQIKTLNYFYYILEIILLCLPTLIIAFLEMYKHRAKLIKNYDELKQKHNEKRLRRYEKKINQLKKGE